jgi:predicted ATPase
MHAMAFDRVIIKNFGCIKELDFALTPLHALIGPNDSGKSTILRAVRIALQLAHGSFAAQPRPLGTGDAWFPFDAAQMAAQPGATVAIARGEIRYQVQSAARGIRESVWRGEREITAQDRKSWSDEGMLSSWAAQRLVYDGHQTYSLTSQPRPEGRDNKTFPDDLGTANLQMLAAAVVARAPRMVRLDPDSLREAGPTLVTGAPIDFGSERGQGLGVVLDAIRDLGDEKYERIRDDFLRVFQTVKRLQFQRPKEGSKAIAIELRSGESVAAEYMSEGMLYYLALSALRHLEPASMVLVEEPENGLYVSRIKGVVEALRETSKSSPVLIATHSPLVVNELEPDEVSLVTRDPGGGTKVVRLRETKDFAERSRIYANGELWLSHADGDQEKDLVKQAGE